MSWMMQITTLPYVDGVSSIASVDFQMDAWGVDVAVSGSRKAYATSWLSNYGCQSESYKSI